MPRPKSEVPTPAELAVLRVLWARGPSTVRDVHAALPKKRAYTSVMSLLNVMADKRLVTRKPAGRAFVYAARTAPDRTLGGLVGDLLRRAFAGSASALVAQLLEQSQPGTDEVDAIRKAIEEYERKQGGGGC
jgi:predicted transcriptional regulator